jgi:hypothetical protein
MISTHTLIEESTSLIDLAQQVQDETQPLENRQGKLTELSDRYHVWYRSALSLFDFYKQPEKRLKFEQEYEGGKIISKILGFLTSGAEDNIFYTPEKPIPLMRWQHPFIQHFKEPLLKQCNILSTLEVSSTTSADNDMSNSWHKIYGRVIKEFIRRAETISETNSNVKKGLTYEHLAIVIISAIEGWELIGQDVHSAAEENDLLISNESQDIFWQRLGNPIIVECKNWEKPLGAPGITILDRKMDGKGVHTAILLSREGITGNKYRDATLLIRENISKHGRHIIVLDKNDLMDIANGIHPAEKLKQKYYINFKV